MRSADHRQRLIGEIHRQRDQVEVLGLNDPLLSMKREKGWNASQCLNHLSLTYALYRPRIEAAIEKGLSKPKSQNFKSGWMGRMMIKNTRPNQKGFITMKMKTFSIFKPDSELLFAESRGKFLEDLKWQEQIMLANPEVDLTRIKVVSAMKGIKLRLGDAYEFLLAHNERHLLQAKRSIITD